MRKLRSHVKMTNDKLDHWMVQKWIVSQSIEVNFSVCSWIVISTEAIAYKNIINQMVDSNDFGWISAAFIGLSMFSFTRHLNAQSGEFRMMMWNRGLVKLSSRFELTQPGGRKMGDFLWQKFSWSNWFCQGDEVCFDGWGTHQSASKQKTKNRSYYEVVVPKYSPWKCHEILMQPAGSQVAR